MPIIVKRIVAYILDIFIVSMVSSLICNTVVNPYYENILILNDEYNEKYNELQDKINNLDEDNKEEESTKLIDEFLPYYKESLHKSAKLSLFDGVVTSVLILLYFVVFAYYFGGETVGKRIFHIKVVSKDEKKVKFGSLLIRALVLYGIPFTLLNLIVSYVLNTNDFYVSRMIIQAFQYILEIGILCTCLISKNNRGLHDMVSHTKVIPSERK